MMKRMMHRTLALLGLLAVAGCQEAGTGPFMDGLTSDEVLELTVLEEDDSYDIALELTSVGTDVASSFGVGRISERRSLTMDATTRFASAREALRSGDRPRALEEAREARRLITRAILATGGQEALDALIERIEELAITAGEDEDVFDDPGDVADELDGLADRARRLLASGDSIGAGERALLGEQRARYRRGRRDHRGDVNPDRARLSVALAETAVSLAERLIAADDIPVTDTAVDVADRRNRWLMQAQRMLERAQRALENGHLARAVHFAQHAHWSALKAVILPGGITEAELEAMVEVTDTLYAQAEAALGDDATELQLRLFERAGRLIELGKEKLAEGNKRGVAALWRASVICAWLLD
jgi:HEPN domain-containing protein